MNKIYAFLLVAILTFSSLGLVLAAPNGAATVNPGTSSRLNATSPQSHNAIAGNITELTIYGDSITQSWQGYFGNVTGAIRLANSSGTPMYNWSLASPDGEIYATVNGSVNWTGTACAVNDTDTPILEANYGIDGADKDGVDETFSVGEHQEFYVNNIQIGEDDCGLSTRIFGDTGAGVDTEFEEVILKAGSGEYVFATLLENDMLGFDGNSHDFEMLVLENGHLADVSTTQYFFYIELE